MVEASGNKLDDLIGFIPKVNGQLDSKIIKNADDFSKYFKTSPKGLTDFAFEEHLTKSMNGVGSFKMSNKTGKREFDGALGNVWWEAKSGNYWKMIDVTPSKKSKFTGNMPQCKQIAEDNGATFELFTNSPIPSHWKEWLTSKGIPFTEILF